ncbi:MAG: hypothetical protein WAO15_18845, partial [Mycobacterium sp.]
MLQCQNRSRGSPFADLTDPDGSAFGDLVELCPLTAGLNGAQLYTADGAVPAAPLCQPALV